MIARRSVCLGFIFGIQADLEADLLQWSSDSDR